MNCKDGMIGAADWRGLLPMAGTLPLVGFPSIKVPESLQSELSWNLKISGRCCGWRTAPGTSFGRLGRLRLSTERSGLFHMVSHRRCPPSFVAGPRFSSRAANGGQQNDDVGPRRHAFARPLLADDTKFAAQHCMVLLSIVPSDQHGACKPENQD